MEQKEQQKEKPWDFQVFAQTLINPDEAHERTLEMDVLMRLLQVLLPKNPNLKVVVISDKLDAGIYYEYFQVKKRMSIMMMTMRIRTRTKTIQKLISWRISTMKTTSMKANYLVQTNVPLHVWETT